MGTRDLPDKYALSPWAYISGKSLVPMLQLLHSPVFPLICPHTEIEMWFKPHLHS